MKNQGRAFESELEATFDSIRIKEDVAIIAAMPVPTAPSFAGGRSVRVLKGKAPFDYYGMFKGGRFLGMEAKATSKVKKSLAIVGPMRRGSGLQWHQLESLATVARNDGVARIVWCNGGLIMNMGNRGILLAHEVYNAAVESDNKEGRKSIPRDLFSVCEQRVCNGIPYTDWMNVEAAICERNAE